VSATRPGRAPPAAVTARPWRTTALIAALAVGGVVVPAQLYAAITLGDPFRQAFDGTRATSVWFGSGFALAYAAGFLALGALSDRFGRRPVLAGGLAALALATAGVASAPTVAAALAFRAVQGFAAAAFVPAALATVADVVGPARSTLALTVVTTGLISSGVVGQVAAQAAAGPWGWRAPLWLSVPLIGALAGALALLVPARAGGAGRRHGLYAPLVRVQRSRPLRAVFVASLAVFASLVGMYAALGPELEERFGLGHDGVLAVRAAGLAGVPAALLVVHAAGPRLRGLAAAAFGIAALGLLVEAASPSLGGLVAGSAVFMMGIGCAAPALVGLLSRLAPSDRGAAIAVNNFMLFVGAAAGTPLGAALDFRPACLVLAGALGAGGALLAVALR